MNKNDIIKKSSGLKGLDFFMLGFGSMIGVGWTVSLNNWFQTSGGVLGTVLAFLLGTLMVIPIGLCYGELTSAMPVSGGAMAFAYRAEGSSFSFLGGWLTSLAYIVLLPWEMIYINQILGMLFPFLNSGTPLYIVFGFPVYLGSLLVGILLTLTMVVLNLKGAEISGKLQTNLTSTILVAAVVIIIAALLKSDINNFTPIYKTMESESHTNFFSGFISMLVIVPFFMAGFDAIPQAVEDADENLNPKKISRIIIFTILAAGLFYILIIFASASAYPWSEFANLESPALAFMLRDIYSSRVGVILYYITMFGSLAGLLSTYNGMFIASTRLLYSMGRSKLLPEFFSKKSKTDTPMFAILFCGLATLIGPFFGTSVIGPLTNVGSLSFVMGWFITSYSTWKLRRFEGDLKRPIKAGKDMKIILLSLGISGLLILLSVIPGSPGFMSYESLIIFGVWLLLGAIFYSISEKTGETVTEIERFGLMFDSIGD